jgi:hypothetical protein
LGSEVQILSGTPAKSRFFLEYKSREKMTGKHMGSS